MITYTRRRLFSGFDGKFCKISPSLAYDGENTVLLSYEMLLLTGSDVTYGNYITRSTDGGKTFSEPIPQPALPDLYEDGIRISRTGTPLYSRRHKRWYGLGGASKYRDDKSPIVSAGGVACTAPLFLTLDPVSGQFTGSEKLAFPCSYDGAVIMHQMIEEENGDLLIPAFFAHTSFHGLRSLALRYRFAGDHLELIDAGDPLADDTLNRGVYEPSLARLGGTYYMTLRSDEMGLWAQSHDGMHYEKPQPWRWDDGSILENYNTQQHWIRFGDALYLAYTRRGAHNDHVFRHRAPIFMTRFDEKRGCLIRDEEVILVPELGARLGNFCVVDVSPDVSWLITAEWMQPRGCEKYGSDNSLWWAEIKKT